MARFISKVEPLQFLEDKETCNQLLFNKGNCAVNVMRP